MSINIIDASGSIFAVNCIIQNTLNALCVHVMHVISNLIYSF